MAFENVIGVNEELKETGIYLKAKIVKQSITSGINKIQCGFPPKLVTMKQILSSAVYEGETDFDTTYSYGFFYVPSDIATSTVDGYFESDTVIFAIGRKLFDGFEINVSSGSGTIYFSCYS